MDLRSLLLASLLTLSVPDPAISEELVVIVNPERAVSISEIQLAQIYMKQRKFWKNGEPIIPVNRESESYEREIFGSVVFADDLEKLKVYWNRQYFLGVLPPATLASDRAVKEFVSRQKSAIGYIRASAVDDTVHVALRLPGSTFAP